MATTAQDTGRPVTGRPAAAAIGAVVVGLVSGVLSAAMWSVDLQAFVIVAIGAFLVFAVIGLVLLAVRETRWLGLGFLVGSALVAAVDLALALVLVADVGS